LFATKPVLKISNRNIYYRSGNMTEYDSLRQKFYTEGTAQPAVFVLQIETLFIRPRKQCIPDVIQAGFFVSP